MAKRTTDSQAPRRRPRTKKPPAEAAAAALPTAPAPAPSMTEVPPQTFAGPSSAQVAIPDASLLSLLISAFGSSAATRMAEVAPKIANVAQALLPLVPMDLLSTKVSAVLPSVLRELRELPVKVDAALDPRLQLAVINRMTGKKGLALTSTAGDEIAVIARVSSVEDWTNLADVIPGVTLGVGEGTGEKSFIVTGRLPIDRVEQIRKSETVLSLKASHPIRPLLAFTAPAMQLMPADLRPDADPRGGEGVVVGIVDFGCDFAHGNFRNADGSTRISAIWNQGAVASVGSPLGYGRLHDATAINAALLQQDPYTALGYGPRPDGDGQVGSHGTHVLDIAAGNGNGSQQPGIAPAAEIIFVEADSTTFVGDGPDVLNQSLGDSVQLLEAVHFIFERAGDKPCVVNLSLGTNGGPHDGTSLVEQGLDALVNDHPNRAVVIAAGNSQENGIHAQGTVKGGEPLDIPIRQKNAGGGELEFWYPGDRRLEVTLIAPDDGMAFRPVAPGDSLPAAPGGGEVSVFISNRLHDPNNRDNVIAIWIAKGLSAGDWTVRLRALDGVDTEFHGWVERDNVTQASFVSAVATHTLGSISTGRSSIVVGSYDAHKTRLPLSSFSSAGPTRDGREKPEVCAPGQAVFAARSRTVNGVVHKSGTSMAAPAVAGLIALIYADALQKGKNLTIDALRQLITDNAVATGGGNQGWDPRSGHGRANGQSIGA